MDILYLLIPLSAVLVLAIIAVFAWALHHGQFDDIEREGSRILHPEGDLIDDNQAVGDGGREQFPPQTVLGKAARAFLNSGQKE